MEVLERAQALERAGRRDHPPRGRRAGLRDAGVHPRGGHPGDSRRQDPLHPQPRPAGAARGDLRGLPPGVRRRGHPRPDRRHLGDLAGDAAALRRAARPRGRDRHRRPALRLPPELRRLSRRRERLRPGRRGGRFPAARRGDPRRGSPRGPKGILVNSPANPTGNLLSAARMAAIAALGPLRDLGRDLPRPGLRGARPLDPRVHRRRLRAQRLLEEVRDDRVAPRLRDRARRGSCGRCRNCSRTS